MRKEKVTRVRLDIHCHIEQFEALSLSFLDTLIPYLPCLFNFRKEKVTRVRLDIHCPIEQF